jgi:hypothetical protein
LGSSLFARHYSGSRGFFPFLWVLRCFSSPACLLAPYVFRYGYARITTREFPHSEILGSVTGQRLPQAYRSRPRPSSALSAKASTVCPCSLDQKNTGIDVAMEFSRCTRTAPPYERLPADGWAGLSKLNSVRPLFVEVDVCSRRAGLPDGCGKPSKGPAPTGVRAPDSLERR